MGFEVRSTDEFDACLDEAVAHRVNNYGLRSARRLLDAVDATSELLAGMPSMGSLVGDTSLDNSKNPLRWIRIDSYIAVYRMYDEARIVYLLKLFRASSNWRRRVLD